MSVPRTKRSLLSTVIASASAKMRKLGSVIAACSARSSSSRVGEHGRILDGHQPVVDAFRNRVPGHRVVHQPAGDVDFAHRAARPRNDLGGQHGADAQLLADRDQHRVDAGRVGGRQLGQVADAHQHLGVRIAPPRLGVALERRHEAHGRSARGSDRSDNGTPQRVQLLEAGLERVERPPRSGTTTTRAPRCRRDRCATSMFEPLTLSTSSAPASTAVRISSGSKRVDADPHAGVHELADDVAEGGKREPRRAADVDDVGAGGAEVLGLASRSPRA